MHIVYYCFNIISAGISLGLHNSPPPLYRKYAMKNAFKESLWFATVLSTYEGTKCWASVYRKKQDKYNTFAGGFAGACVGGLQMGPKFRKPGVAVAVGMLGGGFCVAMETLGW